jgi:preprotein translocase subunit SecE
VTDTSAQARRAGRADRSERDPKERGLFARLRLFLAQILDELRKVVRPTQSELIRYTAVVVVFVVIIMALVSGLDFVLQRLVFFVFSKS